MGCTNKCQTRGKSWAEKGYSWQTRLWIDDMYMITVVQTEAYKVTGEMKYIDRALVYNCAFGKLNDATTSCKIQDVMEKYYIILVENLLICLIR